MSTAARSDNALFGMWAFLATEVLFFGPLFFGYVHARLAQPDAFVSGSHHMHIVLGTLWLALFVPVFVVLGKPLVERFRG